MILKIVHDESNSKKEISSGWAKTPTSRRRKPTAKRPVRRRKKVSKPKTPPRTSPKPNPLLKVPAIGEESLSSVSMDMMSVIVDKMPTESVIELCKTNKRFNAVCNDDFWKKRLKRDFKAKQPTNKELYVVYYDDKNMNKYIRTFFKKYIPAFDKMLVESRVALYSAYLTFFEKTYLREIAGFSNLIVDYGKKKFKSLSHFKQNSFLWDQVNEDALDRRVDTNLVEGFVKKYTKGVIRQHYGTDQFEVFLNTSLFFIMQNWDLV